MKTSKRITHHLGVNMLYVVWNLLALWFDALEILFVRRHKQDNTRMETNIPGQMPCCSARP